MHPKPFNRGLWCHRLDERFYRVVWKLAQLHLEVLLLFFFSSLFLREVLPNAGFEERQDESKLSLEWPELLKHFRLGL